MAEDFLSRASDFDREALFRTFLAETEEHLSQAEEGLLGLETRPGDADLLGAVFRAAHTLKGNAAVLDLPVAEELAHVVEGLLDRLRGGAVPVTSAVVTLLLRAVDTLRRVIPLLLAGDPVPRDVELLARLEDAAAGRRAAALAPGDRSRQAEHARTLRVDVAKLDRMLDLTGEVAVARGRLIASLESLGISGVSALETAREMDGLFLSLQELVMSARMVPVGPTFRRYARTVRDLAAETGRQARLVLEGEDVEVDTAIIERLGDPLTHMIRNAVDHGIETPAARAAAGKDGAGTVTLRAFHEAGNVIVQVSDDGAGLDTERILARGRERGLLAEGASASEADVHRLIFEPGFSTALSVTTVSGRGVGMDVVRRNIEALRGTIGIESRPGRGTTLTIRLPLTLAIIDGLAVGVAGETYVVPLDSVVECLELPADESGSPDGHGVLTLRGRVLPYLRLRHLFDAGGGGRRREHVIVVRHGNAQAGLAVDVLHGEGQVVIKPLDPIFRRLPGIAGSTILGDGRVALILDVARLVSAATAETETAA